LRGVIQSMAMGLGKDVFLRQERAIIGRPDSRPTLDRIAVPTLVLCGRDDQVTPVEVHEELAAAIPGAVLETIDDCGHLSTLDQPSRVSAALADWLDRAKRERHTRPS
jgi:pimeloyl-ACP methyl ester carboxylesterase